MSDEGGKSSSQRSDHGGVTPPLPVAGPVRVGQPSAPWWWCSYPNAGSERARGDRDEGVRGRGGEGSSKQSISTALRSLPWSGVRKMAECDEALDVYCCLTCRQSLPHCWRALPSFQERKGPGEGTGNWGGTAEDHGCGTTTLLAWDHPRRQVFGSAISFY